MLFAILEIEEERRLYKDDEYIEGIICEDCALNKI